MFERDEIAETKSKSKSIIKIKIDVKLAKANGKVHSLRIRKQKIFHGRPYIHSISNTFYQQ